MRRGDLRRMKPDVRELGCYHFGCDYGYFPLSPNDIIILLPNLNPVKMDHFNVEYFLCKHGVCYHDRNTIRFFTDKIC